MSSTAVNAESVIHRAVCRKFDDARGYGFLIVPGYGRDVFVYYGSIMERGFRSLAKGEHVTCRVKRVENGWEATDVRKTKRENAA